MALPDITDEIEEFLDDAEDAVGEDQGPLEGEALDTVDAKLTSTESNIQAALTILRNAGAVDYGNQPANLPDMADECYRLSQEANIEAKKTSYDATYIGNRLKTINNIINMSGGYRELAGTP